MTLKEITFGFENCEVITIDGKYICGFVVDDLHTCFHRVACNSIEKIEVAYIIAIEISRDADAEYAPFGCRDMTSTKFERLQRYNDITSIDFTLVDENTGKEESHSYWVDWQGDCDEINEAQDTYLSSLGNLYIVIAKDKLIHDFFGGQGIDDKEATITRFKMCDVPYKEG